MPLVEVSGQSYRLEAVGGGVDEVERAVEGEDEVGEEREELEDVVDEDLAHLVSARVRVRVRVRVRGRGRSRVRVRVELGVGLGLGVGAGGRVRVVILPTARTKMLSDSYGVYASRVTLIIRQTEPKESSGHSALRPWWFWMLPFAKTASGSMSGSSSEALLPLRTRLAASTLPVGSRLLRSMTPERMIMQATRRRPCPKSSTSWLGSGLGCMVRVRVYGQGQD